MKFRYKAPYNDEVVEFDPGSEIIRPLCGATRPVPYGWKTQTTFVTCENREHHATRPDCYHNALFVDINKLISDNEPQLTAYRISIGQLFGDDVRSWLEKRALWYIMYSVGGLPKGKLSQSLSGGQEYKEQLRPRRLSQNKYSTRNT